MAKYISLDDLLKEIDNLVDKGNYKDVYDRFFARGINSALDTLKEHINTLEVMEINLEKELSYEDYKSFFEKYPNLSEDWGFDESWVFAKYFFELGIQASNPLTWKDMLIIHRCIKDAMNYHLYAFQSTDGQQKVYKEVLKRFKAQKENKLWKV